MTNMRRGFTMIELIFVIVIIGILAAVAIPKLAATRDDARISNIIANTRTTLGDLTAYYTAQGNTNFKAADFTEASSVPIYNTTGCPSGADIVADGDTIIGDFFICDEEGGNTIITIDVDQNATRVNFAAAADDTTKPILTGVVNDPAIIGITGGPGNNKDHKLGGAGVAR